MKARRPTTARRLLLACLLGGMMAGCFDAPRVLQGTVVSHDATAHLLVVKDELPPGREVQLDIAAADVGALPEPGHLVRIAYREQAGKLRASRVANLSRQAEMLGKGGGH